MLRREFGALIVDTIEGIGRRRLEFAEAVAVGERLERMYEAGEFDVCTIVFNRFRSAISQILTFRQLIPVEPAKIDQETADVRPRLRVRAGRADHPDASCCRAISPCRSIARWSRTRQASRARACPRWTMRRATPAT